jgi:homoserine kinase
VSSLKSVVPKRVRVFAPATIANLGSGYDVLGIAIDKPGDVVVASRVKADGLSFQVKTARGGVHLGGKNVAEHVAQLTLDEFKPGFGIAMTLHKLMPIGSGLGSSAASSVASVVAVNALLPKPFARKELLRFAVEGERLATGSAHADNVAPCLLGGAQLIRSYNSLDIISLSVRNRMYWVVVHPHLVVRTEDARNVLPKEISMRSAVRQWGNVGGIVAGLARGDAKLVGKCTEDVVVEPHRAKLVVGFDEVKRAALEAGAFGCSFSGSGPSIFAVASSLESAKKISSAMQRMFRRVANVKSDAFVSKINMQGATISA